MKKILTVVFISMVLTGCEYVINTYPEYQNMEQSTREIDSLEFANLKEVFGYRSRNIKYKSDEKVHGISDYWQAPHETLDRKTGDCEDLCAFVAYFANKLGYETYLIFGFTENGEGHCIMEVDGVLYGYSGYKESKPLNNYKKLTIEQYLSVCDNRFGSRNIK